MSYIQLSLCIFIIILSFKVLIILNKMQFTASNFSYYCWLKNDGETQWNYPKLASKNGFGWEFKDQMDLIGPFQFFFDKNCIRLQYLFPPQCLHTKLHTLQAIDRAEKKVVYSCEFIT